MPGMGKTTIFNEVLAASIPGDRTVLVARPTEHERGLAFNGLGDLLAHVRDSDLESLPTPQRRALRAALLLEDPEKGVIEQRAVAAALRGLLEKLATARPLLVAVDDGQWLDSATADALGYALRRLADQPVAVVVATRPVESPYPTWLQAGAGEPPAVTWLGPLSVAALFHVLKTAVGAAFDRPTLRRIERDSGGNPLHAIELGRRERELSGGAQDAAVGLDALITSRMLALPPETRRSLLVAALAHAATLETLGAVLRVGPRGVLASLEPAVLAGTCHVERGRVEIAHPLYARAVENIATPDDVLACHRALADVETDPARGALHLGRSTAEPNGAVASALQEAAQQARGRGAFSSAVELMELAIMLSPAGDRWLSSRGVALGSWLLYDANPLRAGAVLQAARETGQQPEAWQASLLLARLAGLSGETSRLDALCEEVWSCPDAPPLVRAEAVLVRAQGAHDLVLALEHTMEGRELIPAQDTSTAAQRLRAEGMKTEAELRVMLGQQSPVELLERAVTLEASAPAGLVADRAEYVLGLQLLFADRHDESRAILTRLVELARRYGDDASEPILLLNLGHLEMRAGNWADADRLAAEALQIAEGLGQVVVALAHCQLAMSATMRGDTVAAGQLLEQAEVETAALGEPFLRAIFWRATAMARLASGNVAEADLAFTRAYAARQEAGVKDPAIMLFDAERIEAMITLGDLAGAEMALSEVEVSARRLARPVVLAGCARLRALMLAAAGETAAAVESVPDLVEANRAHSVPFMLGQALLAAGRIQRRAKMKGAANSSLDEAIAVFEKIGALPWASLAREEQRRIGLRRRASPDLTDTERRVAVLAAEGRTNREIADAVFASPKTVEGILSRVYRKLDVRSRVELSRVLTDAPTAHAEPH